MSTPVDLSTDIKMLDALRPLLGEEWYDVDDAENVVSNAAVEVYPLDGTLAVDIVGGGAMEQVCAERLPEQTAEALYDAVMGAVDRVTR